MSSNQRKIGPRDPGKNKCWPSNEITLEPANKFIDSPKRNKNRNSRNIKHNNYLTYQEKIGSFAPDEASHPTVDEPQPDDDEKDLGRGRSENSSDDATIADVGEAFARSVGAEHDQLHLSNGQLIALIGQAEFSGQIPLLIRRLTELANEPPARAPALWDGETAPAIWIKNTYQFWIDQQLFHTGILKKLDEHCYDKYFSRKRAKRMKGEEAAAQAYLNDKLLSESEYYTKRLDNLSNLSELEQFQLQRVKTKRKINPV